MDKSNATDGDRVPPSNQTVVVLPGQGIDYLLRTHAAMSAEAPAKTTTLAELEAGVCMWDLFAEFDSCAELFAAAMASGNASLVGLMLIHVRRGIVVRARAISTAPMGDRPMFDPLLTTPGIAAQVYAAALPSLLQRIKS